MNLHVNRTVARDLLPAALGQALDDPRAELAAQFIPAGSRVLDLSASAALEHLMPNGCDYQRCDAEAEFPTKAAAKSDLIVMLGVLEAIADVESLFTHLRFCKRDVVLSYHPRDIGAGPLSFYELARLFDRYGYRIECTTPVDDSQVLMRLTLADRLTPVKPCSIAVVSCSDDNSFGGRLGVHTINALLPGEADVHHLTFRTLHEARASYDLVVLGTGNSLFTPHLGDDVIDVVSRAKAAIGIFGTQYRELIQRPALNRLLERLDTWFARTQDDVLMYGRGAKNVVHLGDWLIDQFPMSRATDNEQLRLDGDVAPEQALDRAIATIQRHKQVYSAQLHPMLCALTSAELVAYAEEPSREAPAGSSGQFRSMLIDIFGRSFPQKEFFLVDRDAVARYKARVHRNVAKVGDKIDAILRNVAVAAH